MLVFSARIVAVLQRCPRPPHALPPAAAEGAGAEPNGGLPACPTARGLSQPLQNGVVGRRKGSLPPWVAWEAGVSAEGPRGGGVLAAPRGARRCWGPLPGELARCCDSRSVGWGACSSQRSAKSALLMRRRAWELGSGVLELELSPLGSGGGGGWPRSVGRGQLPPKPSCALRSPGAQQGQETCSCLGLDPSEWGLCTKRWCRGLWGGFGHVPEGSQHLLAAAKLPPDLHIHCRAGVPKAGPAMGCPQHPTAAPVTPRTPPEPAPSRQPCREMSAHRTAASRRRQPPRHELRTRSQPPGIAAAPLTAGTQHPLLRVCRAWRGGFVPPERPVGVAASPEELGAGGTKRVARGACSRALGRWRLWLRPLRPPPRKSSNFAN